MSTSVGSDVIFHFLSAVDLVDQPQCALEDDNLELFDEPEEVFLAVGASAPDEAFVNEMGAAIHAL